MKKITLILISFLFMNLAKAQKTDTTIVWYSIPYYDSLGNVYTTKRVFNRIPTREDSIQFQKENSINWNKLPVRKTKKKPTKKVNK
jgi:hypothetical protein